MKRLFNLRALLLPVLAVAALALVITTPTQAADQNSLPDTLDCAKPSSLYCPTSYDGELPATLTNLPTPVITGPVSPIVTPPVTVRKPVTRTVAYQVESRGTITADFAQFKALVADTYANANGWSRLGVQFKEVSSGGSFTVVLAEASQMTTFGSDICDTTYSCTVGRNVIINQDRWQGATDAWNQAGGDLRNYRNMVVNHETGHWLGHGHQFCGGAGQPAPVMQQQSINLQGCHFNPWPLDSEIWSTTLGI